MKRTELAAVLQKAYKPGLSCGVAKVEDPKFANIWFVVPPSPPRRMSQSMPTKALAKAHQVLRHLPSFDQVDDLDRMVSYLFLRREAVQSSRMEGTYSTIDQVLTPGEVLENQGDPSPHLSVINYARSLENRFSDCLEQDIDVFTTELVRNLHRDIVRHDPNFSGKPGQIRSPGQERAVIYIGGLGRIEQSIYNPTPPAEVKRCLKELLFWFRDKALVELGEAGQGMSLPIRLAVGHAHFEAVHPFRDGNGRVGRMIMALQMACQRLVPIYLSGFIEAEKAAYVSALQQAQKKMKYAPIVDFICQAIIVSHEEAERTKAEIRALPEGWLSNTNFRQGSTAQRILPHLIQNPIFRIQDVKERLQVSTPVANRAVGQLLGSGIVRERTGFGRNRIFAAEEVIKLLTR